MRLLIADDEYFARQGIMDGVNWEVLEFEEVLQAGSYGEAVEVFEEAFDREYHKELLYRQGNGKYQLDLWRANQIILEEAGVPREQIHTTDICTHCNPGLLFSHRTMGNERGNLAAFLCLNEVGTPG